MTVHSEILQPSWVNVHLWVPEDHLELDGEMEGFDEQPLAALMHLQYCMKHNITH